MLIAGLLVTQTIGLLAFPGLVHASNLTFGNTIDLSNDPIASGCPVIASSGSNVYVAWLNNTLGNSDVLFKASTNNGSSFGPVINLSKSSPVNPSVNSVLPEIATAGKYVYVVWQQNMTATNDDIMFRASSNNGTSFGSSINLSSDSADSTIPQVAAIGSYVYVLWQTATNTPDILFKASANNGASFGSVINLSKNSHGTTVSDNAHIAASSTNVYAAWRDNSPGNSQTFFTHSTNNGSTFSTAVSLNNHPNGETDIYQQIAAAGSSVYVTWTNDTMFTDNTMLAASTDSGASFSPAINLYKAPVTDLNPDVAASSNYVHVVWNNKTGTTLQPGKDILYKGSTNNGATFGNIINLSNTTAKISDGQMIAASGSNVYVTWSEEDYSSKYDVYFTSSSDGGLTFGNPIDLSPTVGNTLTPIPAISAAGTNVYVTWQDNTQGNGDIFFRGTGSPPTILDVAVTAMRLSRGFFYSGVNANPLVVNVTASNPGTVVETFFVTAKANTTLIGNQTVTLGAGATFVVTFYWYTASLSRGIYLLTANASRVTGETNFSNNNLTWGGTVVAKFKGDVNSDCKVDIVDLALVGGTFGKTSTSAGFNANTDLNNDGKTDIVDLVLVAGNFGQTC